MKRNARKAEKKGIITEDQARTFDQPRGLGILQALATLENEGSLVVLYENEKNPKNYCNPANGYIHASFGKEDSDSFRKIVIEHEASHLSITPDFAKLSPDDRRFCEQHKTVINIVEDVRVNRYVCLKYPGMPRYYDSELGKEKSLLFQLGIGDLVNKDFKSGDQVPSEIMPFIFYKKEIRACTTFTDVLRISRKLVEEFGDNESTGEGQAGDIGDGSGDCTADGSPQDGDGEANPDGVSEYELNEFMQKEAKNNERTSRLFSSEHDEMTGRLRGYDDGRSLVTIKKDKSYFLRTNRDNYTTTSLSKNVLKLLKKEYSGWRRTREGRLNTINLSQVYTDSNLFKRKTYQKELPKAYIVLDGSGSMWGTSRGWQKGLSLSLSKLFDTLGIEHRIFIHSGDKGEFHYSELLKTDIVDSYSRIYTLDGSMLEALFTREIPPDEKAFVFYFSDGGIAAQYEQIQVPLLEKYNQMAEKRKVPIFGIGIQTADVEVFRHWYIVKDNKDFPIILEKIGKLLTKYLK